MQPHPFKSTNTTPDAITDTNMIRFENGDLWLAATAKVLPQWECCAMYAPRCLIGRASEEIPARGCWKLSHLAVNLGCLCWKSDTYWSITFTTLHTTGQFGVRFDICDPFYQNEMLLSKTQMEIWLKIPLGLFFCDFCKIIINFVF